MNDSIKITLIANAGVLVEHDGIGLLVDGIHHEDGHPFSRIPKIDMMHMWQGAGLFSNLDYMMFTHEHPDHFTPRYVSEHIKYRPVKGMFVPGEQGGSEDFTKLLSQTRELGVPCWTLGLGPGETERVTLSEDLNVTVIGTRHMGPQFQDVRNDCYLLSWKGFNMLFTGDADYVSDYYEDALAEISLDAVFVNPIFYHNPNGQRIINEIFRPNDVVIYHMPFAKDDSMNFSYMVNRDIKRNGRPEIKTHILCDEKQCICLPVAVF